MATDSVPCKSGDMPDHLPTGPFQVCSQTSVEILPPLAPSSKSIIVIVGKFTDTWCKLVGLT